MIRFASTSRMVPA
jgi:hypothetical protein